MLLLECLPDETLARKLGYARRELRHLAGKSRICKTLSGSESHIGLIDEDPKTVQPHYLDGLQIASKQHDVRLYRDPERKHKIVVLRPRLEEWLIKTTELAGIAIADFGLSGRGNELHGEINSKIPNVQKLIDHLLEQNNMRLVYLRTSLQL